MARRRVLVVDYSAAQTRGPNAASMYGRLGRRFDLAFLTLPPVPWWVRAEAALRTCSPVRSVWSARYWRALERYRFTLVCFERTTAAYRRAVAEICRVRPPDLIFQYGAMFGPVAPAGIPFVTYHDGNLALTRRSRSQQATYLDEREHQAVLVMERRLVTSAARVLTYSERTRASYVGEYGCAPGRVHAVGASDWVRAGDEPWLQERLAVDEAQLDHGRQPGRVLFVHSDFERKGGPLLLRAFAGVRRQLPHARLQVVGPSPEAARGDGVEALGVVRTRGELDRLYAEAAVFVLPSLNDPFPRVLFEAMAHGTPCIGSDVGGIPEQIRHDETGLVVPAGDERALTDALVRLLADEPRARAMGRAGRRHLAGFLPDAVAERIAVQIDAVLAAPDGAGSGYVDGIAG